MKRQIWFLTILLTLACWLASCSPGAPAEMPVTEPTQVIAEEAAEPETYEPASNNREDPEMSDQELREWMALFREAEKKKKPETTETTETINADGKKVKRTVIRRIRKRKAENPQNLDKDDLDAWQDFINQKK